MNAGDIAFPKLGIYLKNVPVYISLFGFHIYFYGIIIVIGVIAGILMTVHLAKKSGQDENLYWDFALYAVIFSIIGARIYYVIFAWSEFRSNPLRIFNLREGGLAIYGAVIAAFTTLFIYSRIRKKNPFLIGDTAMAGLILGQAIGRWGNFINREVFGEYYNGLFSMQIPIEAVRDPSDITEGIRAHIPEGANYINGRFFIEGIRTDTLFLFKTGIPVSQALSVVMVVFAVVTDIVVRIRLKNKKS